jgi:uridine kinase
MNRTFKRVTFAQGLEEATRFAQQQNRFPLLIAVDGHSAAGKSTFAGALARALPESSLVHTDDFYRPMDEAERFALGAEDGYERYYNWQRLRSEVLEPFSNDQKASYQLYDWARNTLDGRKTLEPSNTVIVEGCYAARPELKMYYGLIIIVEASAEDRIRRQQVRDNASRDWLERWEAAESYYFAVHEPQRYAHLIVSGTD